MSLQLDWCNHDAMKFACKHWHYSGCVPTGKIAGIGVWEDCEFIGAIVFGRGANRNIGKPYGLQQIECCELIRIALRQHKTPVTRIIRIALKKLLAYSPGIRLVISYADPAHGHVGIIYQAANWFYVGTSVPQKTVKVGRALVHKRSVSDKYGTISGFNYAEKAWKHKYIYAIDKKLRSSIAHFAQPYPRAPNRGADATNVGKTVQARSARSN